jgi:hypothetical protein
MLGVTILAVLVAAGRGQAAATPAAPGSGFDTTGATLVAGTKPIARTQSELRPAMDSLIHTSERTFTEIRNSKYLYLLSATAQALATIMTLIFTVTLVVAQLVAPYGLHMSKRAFSRKNLVRMMVFIVATVFSLVALLSGNGILAVVSIALTLVCMGVLVDYFMKVSGELEPRSAIRDLRRDAIALVGAGQDGVDDAVRKLETMAYGALAKGDYELLPKALEAIGEIASVLAERKKRDLVLTLRDSLKALLIEAGARPKPTQEMLWGFVEGSFRSKTGFFVIHKLILETIDAVLASYEWPREEEAYSAIYKGSGRFLELLIDVAPDFPDGVADAVEEAAARLVSTWRRVVRAGSARTFGCGNAAATLQGVMAYAARRAAESSTVRAGLVNSCAKAMLQIGRQEQNYTPLMYNAPSAFERMVDALTKVAPYLDGDIVRSPLEELMADWGVEPNDKAAAWLMLSEEFSLNPTARLVDVAINRFSEAWTKCTDEQAEDLAQLLNDMASKLVAAGYGIDNRLWHAVLALWQKQALKTTSAVSTLVSFEEAERELRPQGGRFLAIYQMADSMLELALNKSRQVDESETTELVANWLVSAALYGRSHVTTEDPRLPPELTGQNRDTAKAVTIRAKRTEALETIERWSVKLKVAVDWLLRHPGADWFVH